jgi:hypothetical protein
MFRRVDTLGLIAAIAAIAGLACFLIRSDLLPAWVAFLAGPLLWFFGTVIGIVWLICRFVPASPAGSDQAEKSSSEQTSGKRRNLSGAAVLILAGIFPSLLCHSAKAGDSATATKSIQVEVHDVARAA